MSQEEPSKLGYRSHLHFKDQMRAVQPMNPISEADDIDQLGAYKNDQGPTYKDQVRNIESESRTAQPKGHQAIEVSFKDQFRDARQVLARTTEPAGTVLAQIIAPSQLRREALDHEVEEERRKRNAIEEQREVQRLERHKAEMRLQCQKRCCLYVNIPLLLVAATILGGVCGSGRCTPEPRTQITLEPTLSPSMIPTNIPRAESIEEYINSITLDDPTVYYHFFALRWLIEEDPRQVRAVDQQQLLNRYVLATLWFVVGGFRSDATAANEWLIEPDACSWYQVRCSGENITGIDLRGVGLGLIPASLGLLTSLTELFLSDTLLDGIPPELGRLTALESLEITSTAFEEITPTFLRGLSKLTRLDLSDNILLRGTLPTEMFRISTLRYLDISGCQFSGTLPDFSFFVSLEYFDVSRNIISGTIPFSLLQASSMSHLAMHQNRFTGTIPSAIGIALSALTSFRIGQNMISGFIPESLEGMAMLEDLQLGGGSINSNRLAGTLPTQIGHLSLLKRLDISNVNNLSGRLPTEYGMLTRLEVLDLSINQLSGPLPEEYALLNRLSDLNLARNRLDGQIPSTWSALTSLVTFSVVTNRLQGTIPTELVAWSSIASADFRLNSFTGTFPFCAELPNGRFSVDDGEVICSCCV